MYGWNCEGVDRTLLMLSSKLVGMLCLFLPRVSRWRGRLGLLPAGSTPARISCDWDPNFLPGFGLNGVFISCSTDSIELSELFLVLMVYLFSNWSLPLLGCPACSLAVCCCWYHCCCHVRHSTDSGVRS